jgi:putative SOS response-associated peptidase YedK
MCNLYSITTNQAATIALFRVMNRYVSNLPPMPGVFPDYPALVIRNTDAGTEMVTMCWGNAAAAAHGRADGHEHSQHVVTSLARLAEAGEPLPIAPAKSFAEYTPEPNPETKKDGVWFAINQDRPLFAFDDVQRRSRYQVEARISGKILGRA